MSKCFTPPVNPPSYTYATLTMVTENTERSSLDQENPQNKYDLFISYAHIDNTLSAPDLTPRGWVDEFNCRREVKLGHGGQKRRVERRPLQVEGYREELAEGVALSMVKIPPGTFLMGSPPGLIQSVSQSQCSAVAEPSPAAP